MARFPYKPGAGAKAIRNPIYWNRLYLQERGRRSHHGSSGSTAAERWNVRWLNLNANLNFFMIGWVGPVIGQKDRLGKLERRKLARLLEEATTVRDFIEVDVQAATGRDLGKFATRIKRIMAYAFDLTIKYSLFEADEVPLSRATYDARGRDFRLEFADGQRKRQFFLGQPSPEQLARVKKLNSESNESLGAEFGTMYPGELLKAEEDEPASSRKSRRRKRGKRKESKNSKDVEILRFSYHACMENESVVRHKVMTRLKQLVGAKTLEEDAIDPIFASVKDLDKGDSLTVNLATDRNSVLTVEVRRD